MSDSCLALTRHCVTWKLSLPKFDSRVLRWGCRAQRKTERQVVLVSIQPAGTVASRWGWPFPQQQHIHKLPLSDTRYVCHLCRTVHAVSFVFFQSAKSHFLWSLLICNMSDWSTSRLLKVLENWLVLKSIQGEFRTSLSFVSLETWCQLQQAWVEQ